MTDIHRFDDDGAPHPPIEYCDWCGVELPDHERDCPVHPEGPEVLPEDMDDEEDEPWWPEPEEADWSDDEY